MAPPRRRETLARFDAGNRSQHLALVANLSDRVIPRSPPRRPRNDRRESLSRAKCLTTRTRPRWEIFRFCTPGRTMLQSQDFTTECGSKGLTSDERPNDRSNAAKRRFKSQISCAPPEMQSLGLGAAASRSWVPQKNGAEKGDISMSYSVTIISFVGADPEQRQARSNTRSKFTVLSVATQRSWKNIDD